MESAGHNQERANAAHTMDAGGLNARNHHQSVTAGETAIALSIQQPWAWLVVNGWKNIENRSWPTKVRGTILICASSRMSPADYFACALFVRGFAPGLVQQIPNPENLERGGIVGQTTILDCVTAHSSEWFCGPYGFVLADSKPLPFRPVKGALRFFRVQDPELVEQFVGWWVRVPNKSTSCRCWWVKVIEQRGKFIRVGRDESAAKRWWTWWTHVDKIQDQ